jgi:hypothetical protein
LTAPMTEEVLGELKAARLMPTQPKATITRQSGAGSGKSPSCRVPAAAKSMPPVAGMTWPILSESLPKTADRPAVKMGEASNTRPARCSEYPSTMVKNTAVKVVTP